MVLRVRADTPDVEDDADEQSFEAADRLAATLALGAFAFEVGAPAGFVEPGGTPRLSPVVADARL